jgi:outer membrane lipoprotein-sorting protein
MMRLIALIVSISILSSGCVVRRTAIPQNQRPLPAQNLSYAEVLQLLSARSQAVKSLKAASVIFRPSAGARKKNELTDLRVPMEGYLLINRPNDIHIHLSAPVLKTTFADMVSDGREYRLWSPMNNNFYVGKADESIQIAKLGLQLPPPKDIAAALFVDIAPYLDSPGKYKLSQAWKSSGK